MRLNLRLLNERYFSQISKPSSLLFFWLTSVLRERSEREMSYWWMGAVGCSDGQRRVVSPFTQPVPTPMPSHGYHREPATSRRISHRLHGPFPIKHELGSNDGEREQGMG